MLDWPKKSSEVRKQNMAQRPSQTAGQKSNHVTPPTQLTGHEDSKHEKKTGNLNKQKPLISQSVKWKVQGIIQGHASHNSTLVKARQNIVLAKSGELIGYVWTLNTYYELLMRLRWAFLWGRFMENGGWRHQENGHLVFGIFVFGNRSLSLGRDLWEALPWGMSYALIFQCFRSLSFSSLFMSGLRSLWIVFVFDTVSLDLMPFFGSIPFIFYFT